VSVRTRSLKPLPPVMSVAVGEQGSTSTSTIAGEFALAQEHAFAGAGRQPSTSCASRFPRSLSARSRLDCSSSGSSTSASIAARSWCSSLPASWLAGLLLLALAGVPLAAALTALWVSFAAALALLTDTLGPSAVLCKLAGIIALLLGAPRHVLRAAGSGESAGREHPLRGPIAR
jgi:hypothetical protein